MTDNHDKAITVKRVLNASPEEVYEAWLDRENIGKWLFATHDGEMQKVELDPREGGGFEIFEKRREGVAEHYGKFISLKKPERIVFDFWTTPGEEVSRVVFEIKAHDKGSEVVLSTTLPEKFFEYEDRMITRWRLILENLDELLSLIKTEAEVGEREIILTRIFEAPAELVFEAWTTHEHLSQWFGPNGFSITTEKMDFREGGVWKYMMHGPDGTDYPNMITYREIKRPELITYAHTEGEDEPGANFHTTVTFKEMDGKTLMKMNMVFPTAEAMQFVIREYGAVQGGQQTTARLANYVEELNSK